MQNQRDFFEQPKQQGPSTEQAHPAIERAYPLAEKILREGAIQIDDFIGFFDEKKLENARQRVQNRERGHMNDMNGAYANVLEAIIYQQIRDGSWFGDNTSAIKTSDFDDYVNGSDIVVELQDPARALYNLSLSIDVTFGTHTEEKKFSKIKKTIDDGTLGEINFFISKQANFRGEISQVPNVVVGLEKSSLIKLADVWMASNADKGTLSGHPIERLILSEILLQLHTFRNYAKEIGRATLIPIYEKDIQILEDIMREQGPVDMSELRNDRVFVAIREALKMFKNAK